MGIGWSIPFRLEELEPACDCRRAGSGRRREEDAMALTADDGLPDAGSDALELAGLLRRVSSVALAC